MDPEELDVLILSLEHDVELRQKIKEQTNEWDKRTRLIVGTLNKIHSTPPSSIHILLGTVNPIIASCHEIIDALAELIEPNQFWRWKDMWTNALRTGVFAAALVEYLTSGSLISLSRTREVLGIKDEYSDRLALPIEDFLHGLISLVNELSRLAVNAVTLGNFEEPIKISLFVKDLFAGFSMLNLKNDMLRRRFDTLKYDITKIEAVVYDVSLWKLAPPVTQATDRHLSLFDGAPEVETNRG